MLWIWGAQIMGQSTVQVTRPSLIPEALCPRTIINPLPLLEANTGPTFA